MSLYHQLETVPIPGIGSMKIGGSTMQEDEARLPSLSLASSTNAGGGEDQFFTTRQQPAQVQPPTQVMDVAGRFFGNGQGADKKRLVLEPEDVNAEDERTTTS